MSIKLVITHTDALTTLDQRGAYYDEQSRSAATRKAYKTDWAGFTVWCEDHRAVSLPATPSTVAAYVTHCADSGRKVATITRYLASISTAHQLAGFDSPTRTELVRTRLKGIKRIVGTAQTQKAAATVEVLRAMVTMLGDDLSAKRDRALLLVGFAGALRRSELVALDVADLEWNAQGVIITLKRSKTDQEGRGREIGIPFGKDRATCPVRALKAWLDAVGIKDGAIFHSIDRHGHVKARLTGHSAGAIVKRYAAAAGFDADTFGGHSLRAGLATSAAAAGADALEIAQQTGHQSMQMVQRYVRRGSLFTNNVSSNIGL